MIAAMILLQATIHDWDIVSAFGEYYILKYQLAKAIPLSIPKKLYHTLFDKYNSET